VDIIWPGKPEEISIGSILRALEGSLAPVDCVLEENAQSCTRADNCVTKLIWEKMRDKINEAVDSISLKDLVQEYNKLNNKDNYMYYI
jgi:DNA-binding IscR family transcriptional regulator